LIRTDLLTVQPSAATASVAPAAISPAPNAATASTATIEVPAPDAAPPETSPHDATTARANELARAYQDGQSDVLAELFELMRPLLRASLQRYAVGSGMLPAPLDQDDLRQQSWIILDSLARRWDPAGGDFPAYVRSTFLWDLWRYVRSLSPGRRARTVRVDNIQHDELLDRYGNRPGVDGRHWDEQLIAAEMLNELDPIARWAFLLHVLEDRSFRDVAQALHLTQAGAYRAYRRALDQLRLRAGLEFDPDETLAQEPGGQPATERLVLALHEGAGPRRRLPGRVNVCARANLSEVRFARLMGLLVARGCVVGRSARKPGRLVYATAEETLGHLRSRR
jgi:RNA polymerase sigma factor (sigma-70 family)